MPVMTAAESTQWIVFAACAGTDPEQFFPPDERHWADGALCAETDPELFFPENGGSVRDAKQVCSRCPVRAECLAYALDTNQRFGVWGGLSERERRQIRRREAA
jgi:WhiB family transcriptional regulator, redox-sensing transcriptional regulator